jgi:hypothetical protein
MMPSMMERPSTGQTPDWMKWIGKQFGNGVDGIVPLRSRSASI